MYSILAGVAIALGCFANLYIGGAAGAILFSIGLILTLTFNWKLYTGNIGNAVIGKITWKQMLLMWIGNCYGAMCTAAVISILPIGGAIAQTANLIIANRTTLQTLILSIGTGVLMQSAIDIYHTTNQVYSVVLPVAVFVLTGMPHCIADMALYTFANSPFNIFLWQIIASTVGNTFGAMIATIYKRRT